MQIVLPSFLTTRAVNCPDATAVCDRGKNITYGTLDSLSDTLASHLLRGGVQKGDRVGILLDKSFEAVASLFGILKAGACYVPLDPQAPELRQAYILNDCGIRHLILSSTKASQARQIMRRRTSVRRLVYADTLFRNGQKTGRVLPLKSRPTIDDLAYILYTSGSTGKPKGVCITHRASLAFVNWAFRSFRVSDKDRVASHAPFHFDLSIFDIFVTMKAGACLCLVPPGISAFPLSLAEFIEKERISTWYSVPYVLIQLVLYGALEKRNTSFLKRILYAGEEFPVPYLRQLMRIIPRASVYNLYGPTETNVCTYYPVRRIPRAGTVPIGKQCSGATVVAVGEDKVRIRPGERGELYVSGPSVMREYWGDPQKTKDAFIRYPLYSREKFYRTGDVVSIDARGNYIFLGRTDGMIKRSGYRIELGEIQTVLYEHPDIQETVVGVCPDKGIQKQIKAEVVLKRGKILSEETIRSFCLRRLPVYMVPDLFVFRDSLPRTSTGKALTAFGVRRNT